ncbi:CIC11C00000004415 [Sungouiella intermedia]|uniref:CIC11C00000004415 n=1 Tax=Sungouiella intermedia TaxID=45354 RepID=A0A1L0E1Y1_9ASCO|nr:CIC11C00000004415 [[Candida] intermedia]
MGACASKDKELKLSEPAKQHPRSRPTVKSSSGKVLGGGGESTENSKEAAARAAELRYQNHQDLKKNSQAKLKAMEKISKREKGLE